MGGKRKKRKKLSEEHWRLFIAVPVSSEVKDALSRWQDHLRKRTTGKRVSFTNPIGIHITLKFLGDTAVSRIDKLDLRMIEALRGFEVLKLRARGTGVFPSPARPRVLWAGVDVIDGMLREIAGVVEQVCRDLGFERETKPFHPHLTLARLKDFSLADYSLLDVSPDEPEFGEWVADEIILYRSQLSPAGARYTPVRIWKLQEKYNSSTKQKNSE